MLLSPTKIQTPWKVERCLLLSWIPNKLACQQMASYKSDDSVQGKMASLEGCYKDNLFEGRKGETNSALTAAHIYVWILESTQGVTASLNDISTLVTFFNCPELDYIRSCSHTG